MSTCLTYFGMDHASHQQPARHTREHSHAVASEAALVRRPFEDQRSCTRSPSHLSVRTQTPDVSCAAWRITGGEWGLTG